MAPYLLGNNAHASSARSLVVPHMKPNPSPTNSYPRSWLFLALPTILVLLAYVVNVNDIPLLNASTSLERLVNGIPSFDISSPLERLVNGLQSFELSSSIEQLYPPTLLNWERHPLNIFASPSNPHRITMSLSNKLSIKDVQLKGERVLIRVDFNVP